MKLSSVHLSFFVVVSLCVPLAFTYNVTTTTKTPPSYNWTYGTQGVSLASWNYEYVRMPLVIGLFVLFAGLVKVVFHSASFMSAIIPESCILIVLGTIMGVLAFYVFDITEWRMTPQLFMLVLLPPIVLESAYSLNDRVFLQNLGTILVYAFIGTILSFLMVGGTLYGLAVSGAMGKISITVVQCFLFASFIVAVDPVAVLAIFQEVGVNDVLYFLVFGESLLNDAVTVVLSNMMKAFLEMEDDFIPISQIMLGIGSFFTISLGGLAIGLIFGVLTALITRLTTHVRVVEPLAVLVLAYLSFIVAELFHWSGIISMIGCGLVQAQYAFHNISSKSLTTVEYFIKMLASIQDSVIFLFLGLEMIRAQHVWHTGFILWSLFLCLVFRAVTVFFLTFICNRLERTHPIKYTEQFIMWYGGLRGAVCFALVETITDKFELKPLFMTATFVVILFTVFVQGVTIKPLVNLCNIALKDEKTQDTLIGELQVQVNDHIMAGMEVIIDQTGQNYFISWLQKINEEYLRRWFQNTPMTRDQQILQVYHNVALEEYEETIRQGTPSVNTIIGDSRSDFVTNNRLSLMSDFSANTPAVMRNRTWTNSSRLPGSRPPSFMRGNSNTSSVDINSASGFRDLLKASASGSYTIHKRYDPNIVHEGDHDMAAQLSERHARMSRYRHQWRQSRHSSNMSSDLGSHTDLYVSRRPSMVRPPLMSENGVQLRRRISSGSGSYTNHGAHDVNIEMRPISRQTSDEPVDKYSAV